MTTIPDISDLPDAPHRGTDVATAFRLKADAMMAALVVMVTQLRAAIAAMNTVSGEVMDDADAADQALVAAQAAATGALAATTYVATSTSSFAATNGSKTVHTAQTGRAFAVDDRVVLIDREDPTVRIAGEVTVSDGSDDYTVVIDEAPGLTGPYDNWFMMLEALEPVYWSTAAMIWAASEARAAVSPKTLKDANAYVSLTYAATLNINLANGLARNTVLTGSPTIAAPTGMWDRAPLVLKFEMGASGGSPSWNAVFDFMADGVPVFPAGLGKFHYVDCEYDAARSKWRATYSPPA